MSREELSAIFEDNSGEYIKFDRVKNKRSKRPDLHAFLLLDEICPGNSDIIGGAAHDEIYLEVDIDDLAKAASPEQVIELIRCGVRLDSSIDSFAMFV